MRSKYKRTKHNKSFLSLNNSLINTNFDKVKVVNQTARHLISLTDMVVNLSIKNLCIDIEDGMYSITDDCYRIAYYLFTESLINKYNFKVDQKSIGVVKDIGRF